MRIRTAIGVAGTCYAGTVAALAVVCTLAPQRDGALALAQIFIPHLSLGGALLLPLAVIARLRATVVAAGVVLVLTILRFGGEWTSPVSVTPDGARIRVASWNLELGSRAATDTVATILELDADVVALQELTPATATELDGDPRVRAIFPYRELAPDPGTLGMGILSRYPISGSVVSSDPPTLEASLQLTGGRSLLVVNVHPVPGDIGLGPLGIPVTFDPRDRDAAIREIRARLEPVLQAGTPFLVVGDFNMVSTEPAYAEFAAGLIDVHVEIANGLGTTWRPNRLEALNVGVLRLDYVFSAPPLAARHSDVDCSVVGDHCIVRAEVVLP